MSDALTPDEQRSLRAIAGIMIPPSEKYGTPGADDDAIFADILRSFWRDTGHVKAAMGALHRLAGGVFADLEPARRAVVAEQFRAAGGTDLARTANIILQCYYRDDRVMRSLNMETRPPFPQGFTVDQGDFSMLDPVRARGKIWRDTP